MDSEFLRSLNSTECLKSTESEVYGSESECEDSQCVKSTECEVYGV